jgi:hypothetical protein
MHRHTRQQLQIINRLPKPKNVLTPCDIIGLTRRKQHNDLNTQNETTRSMSAQAGRIDNWKWLDMQLSFKQIMPSTE